MPREASWRQHRSNRAKHVDLIVPVVPFVTTDNARDVLIESMEGTNVSPGLLRLTARHVADMRTIHSLRNEFEGHAAHLPEAPAWNHSRHRFALVLLRATRAGELRGHPAVWQQPRRPTQGPAEADRGEHRDPDRTPRGPAHPARERCVARVQGCTSPG